MEWKVMQVCGHELQESLERFSQSEYEIFTIQNCESKWFIIARKTVKDRSEKSVMGFRAPD